ncbi:hypothetical protein C7B65_25405 [Phormidesmis priestleyi ULC007]|uniref:Uncharacterized protein n=1 Tax=Phormidesmis priestleyi ULC007 TaxID=1920490 RepID=A0A2T1D3G2_9CYAN|nr:hypothetical protein [Phormidesmis priestleyi]PSB15020.1 hypothetical protein C7B65_25370 [Phormidesmis priestleyi ULC007]PSB15027.1 hypothetical protein C7B65_25405 [Phormidesmis priestleyi ULC007]
MREALTTYGTIQAKIDNSVDRVKSQVDRVDIIREHWNQDADALLPKLSTAFDAARKTSTEAHQAEMRKNAEAHLQNWAQELERTRTSYLKDIRHQGFFQSLGIGTVAILLCSGLSGWVGWQMHQKHWEQRFGSAAQFDWFTSLWFTKDNQQRFYQCHKTQDQRSGEDQNKCTIWYQ